MRRLLAATAGLFVLHVALALPRSGPLVLADELGYLSNARVLTGGLPAELSVAPTYRGGYSVVISPVVGLVSDPLTAYRLVLVVNAVLAAVVLPLLFVLLTRCASVARERAFWFALAGAV